MIDYSDCTKEKLTGLVEQCGDLIIMHNNSGLFRVHESTEKNLLFVKRRWIES